MDLLEALSVFEKEYISVSDSWAVRLPTPGKMKVSKESIAALRAKFNATLKGASAKAMQTTITGLSQDLEGAMRDAVWSWPGSTIRSDGSTAGAIRNIVDTNRLNSSLKWKKQGATTKGYTLFGIYKAPYATQVHYGAYVKPYGNPFANAVWTPGRPWVEGVLFGNKGVVDPYDVVGDFNFALENVWKSIP